jgi:hypothetical protein
MLVGRHGLRRELPADPVGFLRENDRASQPQRRQGCGHAAQAAAHDENVGVRVADHRAASTPQMEWPIGPGSLRTGRWSRSVEHHGGAIDRGAATAF